LGAGKKRPLLKVSDWFRIKKGFVKVQLIPSFREYLDGKIYHFKSHGCLSLRRKRWYGFGVRRNFGRRRIQFVEWCISLFQKILPTEYLTKLTFNTFREDLWKETSCLTQIWATLQMSYSITFLKISKKKIEPFDSLKNSDGSIR